MLKEPSLSLLHVCALSKFNVSAAGLDFNATSLVATLPASKETSSVCVSFPILNDSVAFENEAFGVSFEIVGQSEVGEPLKLTNGRYILIPGFQQATVVIIDETGMLLLLLLLLLLTSILNIFISM